MENPAGKRMSGKDFLQSEWVKDAEKPGAEERTRKEYESWSQRVGGGSILLRAGELWNYLVSGHMSAKDKIVLIAALAYVICPIDLIPDAIPVIGFLDDLGVAAFALNYIHGSLDEADLDAPIVDSGELVSEGLFESTCETIGGWAAMEYGISPENAPRMIRSMIREDGTGAATSLAAIRQVELHVRKTGGRVEYAAIVLFLREGKPVKTAMNVQWPEEWEYAPAEIRAEMIRQNRDEVFRLLYAAKESA